MKDYYPGLSLPPYSGLFWTSMSLITGLLSRVGKLGGGDVKALIALSSLSCQSPFDSLPCVSAHSLQ
ncbi:hypothetical protein [Methanosarcina spelaei]|uniref:hypothetical protein n=1 Tax=Methanosarcina spelaei TaxID=1036679 RepID=UPI001141107E|nr:hypothetical protein [Methanosarcina spelaei]